MNGQSHWCAGHTSSPIVHPDRRTPARPVTVLWAVTRTGKSCRKLPMTTDPYLRRMYYAMVLDGAIDARIEQQRELWLTRNESIR